MPKIALLSNVNIMPHIKQLNETQNCYMGEGYGNIFEEMLNSESSFNQFDPDVVFIFVDLSELLENAENVKQSVILIEEWFSLLKKAILKEKTYFIFDADMRESYFNIGNEDVNNQIENKWNDALNRIIDENENVYKFHYKKIIGNLGKKNAYSDKLWYLGKIVHSQKMQEQICEEINHLLVLLEGKQKKLLVLDLDNTLWGGVIGESEITEIRLGKEKDGLIYRNVQKIVKRMKETGVLLGIASKNNEEDVFVFMENHSGMVLNIDDFVVSKINWETKAQNILEMAKDLNIGTDSIVFVDDNPVEREMIRSFLPEVIVPEFPKRIENYPDFMQDIFETYFKRLSYTKEDFQKTDQYFANIERSKLEKASANFSEYLKALNIQIKQVEASKNIERLHQLVQKTNQFNLTTKRYSKNELMELLSEKDYKIYLFQEQDKFGDNGIIAALFLNLKGQVPVIENFIMSCRVIGKNIENYIIEKIEKECSDFGYDCVRAHYMPTNKNKPVAELYKNLNYCLIKEQDKIMVYEISLHDEKTREFYLEEVLN